MNANIESPRFKKGDQVKTIYDIGANNGDDIPYYLKKAGKVVAIDANPVLCESINSRFADEIAQGRLSVVNCVVTNHSDPGMVPFYVHKTDSGHSQFGEPAVHEAADFEVIRVPACTPLELIQKHGTPHYIKIDVEGHDHVVLEALFRAGIRPPFISAECHSLGVFWTMAHLGGYKSFNLLDAGMVESVYGECRIMGLSGPTIHRFERFSAGPFGHDLRGSWMRPGKFFQLLSATGLGWRDVHASSVIGADPSFSVRYARYLADSLRHRFRGQ
jgi:FkbM family methyltransferase